MKTSVREQFIPFSKTFEGYVHWMYLDIKGLVTVGIGNLIDPRSLATSLPFTVGVNGPPASAGDIGAEWDRLKKDVSLARKGYKACEGVTRLRLGDAAIDAFVYQKLDENEKSVRRAFPDWDSLPADAQLGILSMAWAMGPGFPVKFPGFTAACNAGRWAEAAEKCHMRDSDNPGLVRRNRANRLLFQNAASCADPEVLVYPQVAAPVAVAAE